jgi:hypothetical protein
MKLDDLKWKLLLKRWNFQEHVKGFFRKRKLKLQKLFKIKCRYLTLGGWCDRESHKTCENHDECFKELKRRKRRCH